MAVAGEQADFKTISSSEGGTSLAALFVRCSAVRAAAGVGHVAST